MTASGDKAARELPPTPAGRSGWPWDARDRHEFSVPQQSANWPRITIVTPSYNQGQFLEATIRSVLLQGYPNLEYLVLDGGSTDDSVSIIRRYEPWLDYWVSAPDGGQSRAINQGFGRATGQVLAWLNSDDIYLPSALALAAQVLNGQPQAALLYGNADLISDTGELIAKYDHVRAFDRRWLLEQDNLIAQPATFFRRDAFAAAGGLDEGLHYCMDWDLWLRLGSQGQVVYRPEVLAQMRVYEGAKTFSGNQAMFDEVQRVVERHGGHGLPAGLSSWLVSSSLARAMQAYRQNDSKAIQAELAYILQKVPALGQDPGQLAELLAGQVWRLAVQAGIADSLAIPAAEALCQQLPAHIKQAGMVRRHTLALLFSALAFRCFEQGDGRATRRNVWRAIANDPSRLRNRGLWSIAVRSYQSPVTPN